MSTFGERLRDARKAAGLSQAELARLVGVDQTSVSKTEASGMSSTKVLEYAKVLKVNPNWLDTGKGSRDKDVPHPLDDYKKLFDEADVSTRRMILSVLKSLKINDSKNPSPSGIDEQSKQVNT